MPFRLWIWLLASLTLVLTLCWDSVRIRLSALIMPSTLVMAAWAFSVVTRSSSREFSLA